LIDSSKSLTHLALLSEIDNIDIYCVHIVRDPRAIEYSLLKRKLSGHKRYVNHSILNLFKVDLENLSVILFAKRFTRNKLIRLKYEDLVNNPKATIDYLFSHFSVAAPVDYIYNNVAKLSRHHSVAGSPSRQKNHGSVNIYEDMEWKAKLPKWRSTVIKILSFTYWKFYKKN
jgi:hypothetical protein